MAAGSYAYLGEEGLVGAGAALLGEAAGPPPADALPGEAEGTSAAALLGEAVVATAALEAHPAYPPWSYCRIIRPNPSHRFARAGPDRASSHRLQCRYTRPGRRTPAGRTSTAGGSADPRGVGTRALSSRTAARGVRGAA
jgi:hypothetical protein